MARNVGDAFPSKFLKASDLGGRRILVTIHEVKDEEVGKDKEVKPVCYFEGKEKGLVLNKTNATKIQTLLGTGDFDEWPGGQIVIFATMVEAFGEQAEAIRVAAVPPNQTRKAAPKPPPPPAEEFNAGDDDVPF